MTMKLEDIFQWLAVGRKSGLLEVRGTIHTKRVYFQDGKITSVWSSDPREYLGQFLLAFNRITEAQLREALASQEDENQLLGRILVNRNLITEAEIRRILQFKVEETVFDIFLWTSGNFEFHDGMLPGQRAMLLSLDVTGIVLEGARRLDEWSRIRKIIKGGDAVFAAVPEAIAQHLPLQPQDADLLARLDGVKTLDQLGLEMRATEFKLHKSVFDLHEKGMVRAIDAGGKLGENASLQLQRARQLVEKQALQEAQDELKRLMVDQPHSFEASRMLQVVETMMDEQGQHLDPEIVLELAVTYDELLTSNLAPNEGFLASRVNGVWSIRDIMSISPFANDECLSIFAKLMKRGILKNVNANSGGVRPYGRY